MANKRHCVRPPEDGAGLADTSVEIGMYKYILDLDGRKHPTHNKADIAVREKDLGFVFRAVDEDRWEYVMGTDFLLQAEEYRLTILQQGRLRADRRHRAFKSCGSGPGSPNYPKNWSPQITPHWADTCRRRLSDAHTGGFQQRGEDVFGERGLCSAKSSASPGVEKPANRSASLFCGII